MYIFAAQAYLYIAAISQKLIGKNPHNNLKTVGSVVFEVLEYIFYH